MELKDSFQVPASPDLVWDFLLRVEEVIPCMPGAELTEVIDETHWKGRVNVKLGPVSLSYAGKVALDERDNEARRMVLKAQGTESRGKGMASATVTCQLQESADHHTDVEIVTDLTISGPAAQFGRGMVGDVSKRFTAEFAKSVAARILENADGEAEEPPAQAAPKPISGFRLALWALFRALGRALKRPFARP